MRRAGNEVSRKWGEQEILRVGDKESRTWGEQEIRRAVVKG